MYHFLNTTRGSLMVWLPVTVVLLASSVTAWLVYRFEESNLRDSLQLRTENAFNGLRENLLVREAAVQSMATLLEVNPGISRADLDRISKRHLGAFESLQALSWVSMVSHADRKTHAMEVRGNGFSDYSIKRWDADRGWVKSGAKWADDYFPVSYIYPLKGNAAALGIDLASNPTRATALKKARDTGRAVATSRIDLAQSTKKQSAFLLLVPVYRGTQETTAQRRKSIAGYSSGVFRIEDIVQAVFKTRQTTGLRLVITDQSATSQNKQLLFSNLTDHDETTLMLRSEMNHVVGGRNWKFKWGYLNDYVLKQRTWHPWWLLFSGCGIASLLGVVLSANVKKTADLQRMADGKTEVLNMTRRQLQTRTSELECIFEAMPLAIIYADPDRNITRVNTAFTQIFGYPANEAIGQTPKFIYSEPEQFEIQGKARFNIDAADHLTPYNAEYRKKNGTTFTGETVGTVVRDSTGNVTGMLGLVKDITQRKQNEAAVLEAKRLAEESERRFRSLADSASSLFWTTELDSNCSWLNKRWLDYCGRPLEEQIGRGWLETVHPDDRDLSTTAYLEAFEKQIPFVVAYRLRRHDGVYRWHTANATPRLNEKGEFIGFVGMSTDDQDAKESREALEESEQSLRNAVHSLQALNKSLTLSNSDLQQFAYVASHDLQEPLRAVSGFAQLLKSDYGERLDERGIGYTEKLIAGAARMQQLIGDLLHFSQVTRDDTEFSPVDLGHCIELAQTSLQNAIETTKAEINVNGDLPVVQGIESQLMHLFMNLINNAIKYCKQSPPRIEISANRDGNNWVILVQDNGIGIAPEYHDQIFSIFKRLHHRAEYPGTGIGLAVCRRVVDRHSGTISVTSPPAGGSCFNVTLPTEAAAQSG